MKISELTENDVIRVDNERELKTVWKLLKRNGFTFNNRPMESPKWFLKECWSNYRSESSGILVCSGKDLGHCRLSYYKEYIYNIIPASKFLKQSISKKDLHKALSKVGEELSSMNERLGKLEAKSEPKTANGIEIHFDEVTEGLPEKWCVGITSENENVLLEYWRNLSHNKFDDDFHGCLTSDCYDGYWCHWGGCFAAECSGYTEITFETFKKYVLKEEVKEAVELEVGKWYTLREDSNVIACYLGEHRAYGLNGNGIWSTDIRMSQIDYWEPATESEVFEALKAEAEKRGFKEGVVIESLNGKGHLTLRNEPKGLEYRLTQNDLVCSSDIMFLAQIFHNGQWATIIDQPEAIDFSKAGQLVKSDDVIVITDGNHTSEMFSGMRLFSHVHYSDYWAKEKFTLCTEPVTLQK